MIVKKYDLVDYTLLILMYLQLVILEFFGFGQTLNKVVVVLILYRVLFMRGGQWKTGVLICCGLGFVYMLGMLFGIDMNGSYALSNFLMQLYPAIYTYYIVFLCRNRAEVIDTCLKKGFWLFNLTMVINIFVLFIQIFVPYSIVAVVDEAYYINYYEDNISGLFQYASTHVVCLFTIFIALYDISFGRKVKNRTRIFINMLVIVMILVSFFIAANNDNRSFFLLLPLSLFAYWYSGKIQSVKKVAWIVVGFLFIPLIIYGIYISNSAVREFIDANVLNTLDIIVKAHSLGSTANGSNERIAIIFEGLGMLSTWFIGKGFGSTAMYGSGFLGYNHFGQSDFGSILVLGGIWYLLLLLCYYLKSFVIIIGRDSFKNNRALKWSITIIVVCIAVYTQCFSRTNVVSALILIMLAFRVRFREEVHVNVLEETKVNSF